MFEAGYGISTISYNLQRSEVAIYQQIEKQDLYCDKTRLNQVLLNFLSNPGRRNGLRPAQTAAGDSEGPGAV